MRWKNLRLINFLFFQYYFYIPFIILLFQFNLKRSICMYIIFPKISICISNSFPIKNIESEQILYNFTDLLYHSNPKIKRVHYDIYISENFKKKYLTNQEIFQIGIKCLSNSKSPYGVPNHTFVENAEKRYNHYIDLKKKTEEFRNVPGFCYGKYCGEWVEEVWINTFINEKFETFGPYIPVFIPWLNIYKKCNENKQCYQSYVKRIFELLEPDFLYITVVQSARGITESYYNSMQVPSNLIILNPAGIGHIPIPHLMRVLNISDIEPSQYVASFIGTSFYLTRKKTIEYFANKYKNKFFFATRLKNWVNISKKSKVSLSPRGYANACWRTYEMLQQGFIPVIISDDIPWLPYRNTDIPWKDMIIIGHISELDIIDQEIQKITEDRRLKMRETILKYRHFFTYHGLMEEIALFMQGRGHLKCDLYNTRINDGKHVHLSKNVQDQRDTNKMW